MNKLIEFFVNEFRVLVRKWRSVLSDTFNRPGQNKILLVFQFTIKSGIFFAVAVLIYRSKNHFKYETMFSINSVLRKDVPRNSNDTLEEAVGSDKLPSLLLSPPKGTKSSGISTERDSKELIKERSILSDPSVLEPEQAETEQGEPEQAETEQAEMEQVKTEQGEPEQAETEQAEMEQVKTEQGEPEQAETEQSDMEQSDMEQSDMEQSDMEQLTTEQAKQSAQGKVSRIYNTIDKILSYRIIQVLIVVTSFWIGYNS